MVDTSQSVYWLAFSMHRQKPNSADDPGEEGEPYKHFPCWGAVQGVPFSLCLEWLDEMMRCRFAQKETAAFAYQVRFQQLLLLLFQNKRLSAESASVPDKREAVERSIQHMLHYCQEMLTVEELARIAQVDRWRFTRLFKQATGQLPLDFLNDVRIERTKKMLAQTDDRLQDIAAHVGFNNEYYLYEQCRRISHTCVLPQSSENWRFLLRKVADYFGRTEQAEEQIAAYEAKAQRARRDLQGIADKQSVACLRISADHIFLYANAEKGFSGSVLYRDLGLHPYRQYPGFTETEHAPMVSLTREQLAHLQADHLFVTFDKWHTQAPGAERDILADPVWSALPAVRNQHVYEVDFLTWMNNGMIANTKKLEQVVQALG